MDSRLLWGQLFLIRVSDSKIFLPSTVLKFNVKEKEPRSNCTRPGVMIRPTLKSLHITTVGGPYTWPTPRLIFDSILQTQNKNKTTHINLWINELCVSIHNNMKRGPWQGGYNFIAFLQTELFLDFPGKPDLSSESQVLHEKLLPMGLRMVTPASQTVFKNSSKNRLNCENLVLQL